MGHQALRKRPLDLATGRSTCSSGQYYSDWCLANLPDFVRASEWPGNSPDLNILDFSMRAVLEQKACQKKHTSVHALKKSLEKAWNEIPQDHERAAVESYPERLKAVICTRGGHYLGFCFLTCYECWRGRL
ncbi:hypothetical protein ANCDUO_14900 [Ancylostoma duodenale]|uniref:Uncharacterized protein n=1 Tax=Ancylostoma duodenale TaxID=51022 RepID=A0A0C2GD18_9BILA|nr:hypothetical protein ANCDUO_14900 [Ancylostoma duodenale]